MGPFGPCSTCRSRPGIAYVLKAPESMEDPLDRLVLVSICYVCLKDYLELVQASEANRE